MKKFYLPRYRGDDGRRYPLGEPQETLEDAIKLLPPTATFEVSVQLLLRTEKGKIIPIKTVAVRKSVD